MTSPIHSVFPGKSLELFSFPTSLMKEYSFLFTPSLRKQQWFIGMLATGNYQKKGGEGEREMTT